ncbi:MAG: calcium-binding protein [Patescibacteria group bacterium]
MNEGHQAMAYIVGTAGTDFLLDTAGDDVIDGLGGDDYLFGSTGNDTYLFGRGSGQDQIFEADATPGNLDTVLFAADVLPANIQVTRNASNIYLTIADTGETLTIANWFLDPAYQIEQISFADGTRWDVAAVEALLPGPPPATEGPDVLFGTAGDDVIDGLGGDDQLYGYDGNDTLTGGAGNDSLYGDVGNDTLTGGAGNDYLSGDAGDDTYLFGLGDGADVVSDSSGIDTLQFAAGIQTSDLVVTRVGDNLSLANATTGDTLLLSGWFLGDAYKIERAVFADGTTWDSATLESQVTTNPTEGPDILFGTPGDDVINGLGGDDELYGNGGNDTLDGGAGNDYLVGGDGNDTYLFDRGYGQDTVNSYESTPGSVDTVQFAAGVGTSDVTVTRDAMNLYLTIADSGDRLVLSDWFIDPAARIEQVVFADGTTWDPATLESRITVAPGTEGADVLYGTSGNDTLNGLGGDDLLYGAAGNDKLNGGDGNDLLDGGTGKDVMIGGDGDDTYVVDHRRDVVREERDGGTDTVESSISYKLGKYLENLTLTGTADIDATGNKLDNILTGNDGNNVLDGGRGADSLTGGLGDDTYIVDDVDDAVYENADEGLDTVRASVSYSLSENLENLTLVGGGRLDATGNDLDNVLTGNNGRNILDGGLGADTLIGGGGNDTYIVDDAGDTVVEDRYEGTDTVLSSISYILGDTLENLTLTGADDLDATGNARDNVLTGNDGNNVLDGGLGEDILIGGLGDDTYVVDDRDDEVVENADEGTDTVEATINYTLGDNVENLILNGTGNLKGTGNALDNVLTGNDGDNVLNGGLGADTLMGGAGNDTYVVDDAGDTVAEDADAGTDSVQSSVSFALDDNIENLTLTGSADIDASGNDLDNVLTGNAGDNILDGGEGNDTLIGGRGNDTYLFGPESGQDVIFDKDNAPGNLDTLLFSPGSELFDLVVTRDLENLYLELGDTRLTLSNWFAGEDFRIEQLVFAGSGEILDAATLESLVIAAPGTDDADFLFGGSDDDVIESLGGDDTVYGFAGNDTLDGGLGADTLIGGIGDDSYVVDDAGDVVVEDCREGTDTVLSSVSYTLDDNVENLTLTGTADINATGNDLDNILIGNDGNNVLAGGAGNDTYVLNNAGDTVVEKSGKGTDTVLSGFSYTLGDNLENLTLTGSDNINATGNKRDNVLTGNDGNNILDGGKGHNTLAGGAGDDTLILGKDSENDVLFNSGDGWDTLKTNAKDSGHDNEIRFGAGITHEDLWFSRSGNNLNINILGTDDGMTIEGWYSNKHRPIDEFETANGYELDDKKVALLVQAMAGFTATPGSGGMIPTEMPDQLQPVLAAAWEYD